MTSGYTEAKMEHCSMMLEMESVQDSMRGSMMGSVQVRKCSQFQKYLDTLRELMHLVSCSPFFCEGRQFL